MTTMRAVVKCAVDASDGEKEVALWVGLDEVIYELVCEHGAKSEDIENRCYDAIESAVDGRDSEA